MLFNLILTAQFYHLFYSGVFEDPQDLLQFVRKDHGDGKFYCTVCEKFAHKYSSGARNHVESQHFPNLFTYPCTDCEMIFSTKSNFALHRSRKHINPKKKQEKGLLQETGFY